MEGEAHRQEVLKDGVLAHLNRQASGALKRATTVGRAGERSDVIVYAPAGDEYESAVKAAELAAACRPHILVVLRAVGDHWRKGIAQPVVMTRAGRVQTLSKKAKEAGFVSHSQLATAAGAVSKEEKERKVTSKR
uniref:Uncharacterized protein n=1 Tax=Chromera velia CCMP2878 TaxID=1169474 RepID=A0A0G4HIL7_9ALVE|eukprot:Cvel_7027.t1-p1 / transcript=Cvel_7027.t1 / gene=Cvel_7027 / organism=Chromera_velia_CCMP2878 / gene_product=hypothetical protein / transcript_product=hypothetical protein / location=Cvel_scaffold358:53546-54417(+) / protein_length=134 / sequence_SO=supercontig / SO=protein_coding / is_pseudo=false